MPNLSKHKKILISLFIFAVALILANIIIEKFFLIKPSSVEKLEYSDEQVNQNFKSILTGFGIDDSLVKSKTAKDKKTGRDYIHYSVTVPPDLPIPVVISDVYSAFADKCNIESREIVKGGKSYIGLNTPEKKILGAEFVYSKKLIREKGKVGFFIQEIVLEEKEDSLLFYSPEKFCVLIIPSKLNSKVAAYCRQNGKEYAVLLNDDIAELEYKIKAGFSETRIKSSMREILGAFSKSIFFVIDDKSDVYNSDALNTIENELKKRNIKFILLSKIYQIESEDDLLSASSFDDLVKELKPKDELPLLVSLDVFKSLNDRIRSFRKLGVKFVNPSTLTY